MFQNKCVLKSYQAISDQLRTVWIIRVGRRTGQSSPFPWTGEELIPSKKRKEKQGSRGKESTRSRLEREREKMGGFSEE